MKKFAFFVAITAMLLSMPAIAANGDSRVVIAADLTKTQIAEVYKSFGIEKGSVPELTITNELERKYLEGVVPEEQLGTKSISCVYISTSGSGISVETKNINWCTDAMYMSAMATAGIENASVVVAAPVEVSGTAALAGIYVAYEDMTGETLADDAKLAGALELVTTAELANELGGKDAITIVTELKLILDKTKEMSDEELAAKIDEIAKEYKISLNDTQREKLIEMCRGMEKLDPDALRRTVEDVKQTLEKMDEFKDKTVSFWGALSDFFSAVGEFFSKITAIFAK